MAVADSSTRTQTKARARSVPAVRNLPVFAAVALAVIGIAGILPLRLNTTATTTSFSITELEDERAYWQAKTVELQNNVATLATLDRIDREAKARLGMVPASDDKRIVVTTDTPYSAPAQGISHVPNRFLPPSSPGQAKSTPLWRSILEAIPLP